MLSAGGYVLLAVILGWVIYAELKNIEEQMRLLQVVDDIRQDILEVRRYEKNYLLYHSPEDREEVTEYLDALQKRVEANNRNISSALDSRAAAHLVEQIGIYRTQFQSVVRDMKSPDEDRVSGLRVAGRELHETAEKLALSVRSDVSGTVAMAEKFLGAVFLVAIVVGLFVNIRLAMRIAEPMQKLEAATRKIAEGEFSSSLNITGSDEIASLAYSFEEMERKLQLARTELEQKIQELQGKQDQLVEAEKHASVGILAAGIAHEINNPLTSILTFSHLILEDNQLSAPAANQLKIIISETEKARTIIKQLLYYSREVAVSRRPTVVADLLSKSAAVLCAQGMCAEIEIQENYDRSAATVSADPIQLEQVFVNLIRNAAQAITPPGVIALGTKQLQGRLEVSVRDTGGGISPEALRRLFDPFFTTKPPGEGTGIGLAVSYAIVRKHGGEIIVESIPGSGTTFTVLLPSDG